MAGVAKEVLGAENILLGEQGELPRIKMLIFDPALNTSFIYVIVPINEIGLHRVRAVADTSHTVFL